MGSMPTFALEEWNNLMNGFGPAGAADPMYVPPVDLTSTSANR